MMQRILAVDDEPAMLLLLERIVRERTPYSIVTTNNPLEVPAILDRDRFDLIVTDLKMAGLDGLEILRLIREKGRSELVIILTAFGAMESSLEAMSMGAFDYLTKPFKKEQILHSVDRAMRCQRAQQEEARLVALFALEPYRAAEQAFRLEYLRRLADRCGGQVSEVARRAGLPAEEVREAAASP